MLKDNEIKIIGLSEMRLDTTISDSEVNISGYFLFRNDRDVNGGGVAIYACMLTNQLANNLSNLLTN